MHMGDALLSPVVAGGMCAVAAGGIAWCSAKVRTGLDERKVPLMGVLGAFVFSVQMLNFTIPGTGSSGHLGGGLLLAILLGPHAAFLTIASVLVVQALLFADGGLLALGANIVNLGFFPAFIAFPLVYRPLSRFGGKWIAAVAAAVVALEAGAFCVTAETSLSGIVSLPFHRFLPLMLGIHLPIGIVEGVVTAAVVAVIRKARPDVVEVRPTSSLSGLAGALLVPAFVAGGILSWYASDRPDGLEWAVEKIAGGGALTGTSGIHRVLDAVQTKAAPLPGYAVPGAGGGTSLAGVIGGAVSLGIACGVGLILKKRKERS